MRLKESTKKIDRITSILAFTRKTLKCNSKKILIYTAIKLKIEMSQYVI